MSRGFLLSDLPREGIFQSLLIIGLPGGPVAKTLSSVGDVGEALAQSGRGTKIPTFLTV